MKRMVIIATLVLMISLGIEAMAEQTQKKNPYEGNPKAGAEGAEVFKNNCQVCHGVGAKGDICPDLTTSKKKYGDSDAALFLTISKGTPGGMPNWDSAMGADRIWKVITYIRRVEKK